MIAQQPPRILFLAVVGRRVLEYSMSVMIVTHRTLSLASLGKALCWTSLMFPQIKKLVSHVWRGVKSSQFPSYIREQQTLRALARGVCWWSIWLTDRRRKILILPEGVAFVDSPMLSHAIHAPPAVAKREVADDVGTIEDPAGSLFLTELRQPTFSCLELRLDQIRRSLQRVLLV